MNRPRPHRHLKRKDSILFLIFLGFSYFFPCFKWRLLKVSEGKNFFNQLNYACCSKKRTYHIFAEKLLAKVTVKEICELSEINRATFYKYYCDPYDLLDKIENDFLEELENSVSESIHKGFQETITFILISIKAEGELYKTLFSENGDPHFPSRIFSSCYKKYTAVGEDKRFHLAKELVSAMTFKSGEAS